MENVARTNVALGNVTVTVAICSRCSQEPIFEILSKSSQKQLRKVCGGGGVVGWLRPVLGFSLSQAEQKYFSKYGKSNNLQDFPIYYRYSSIS